MSKKPTQFENNLPFKYPEKSVRFLEAQKRLDSSSNSSTFNGSLNDLRSFVINRGFIKNLQPGTLVEAPLLGTCYFQFNPQEIRQNVQMREDIYNPIMLTPEQLAQPIGGNVNFQFDLFFDRSFELASRPGGSGLQTNEWGVPFADNDPRAAYRNTTNDPNDPTGKEASQIGVYADLKVLYNIIGQGLSDGTIDLQLETLRSTYNAKVAREGLYESKPDEDSEEQSTTTPEVIGDPFTNDFTDREKLRQTLLDNVGNAAFLLPNPVRIVFSPLLMVDGFVTNTSVDFLKFTSEMIPMQCRVAMSVNALYIGFNKQRTFLTSTISTARESLREERETDTAAVNTVEKEMLKIVPFRLALGASPAPESWGEAMYDGPQNNQLVHYLSGNDSEFTSLRVVYAGFPVIKPVDAQGRDKDPILILFEDASITFSVGYSWRYQIYGKPNQNQNNGIGYTLEEAKAIANVASTQITIRSDGDFKPTLPTIGGTLVGDYSATESASGKGSWGSGVSGNGSDSSKVRRRTYTNVVNNSSSPLNTGLALPSSDNVRRQNVKNSYYVVKVDLEVSVTSGTITKVLKPVEDLWYLQVLRGSDYTGVATNYPGNPQKLTSIDYVKVN